MAPDHFARRTPRPAQRLPSFDLGGQVGIAAPDKSLEIAGQDQPLERLANHSERRRELDPVDHSGHVLLRSKQVLMPEVGERSADLFVYEPAWTIESRDPAPHAPRNPEMPGPPFHLVVEGHPARGDSG